MNRKTGIIAVMLVLALCFAGFFWLRGQDAADNPFANGGFDALDAEGMPSGWTRNMWLWGSEVSGFSVEPGLSGNALKIENHEPNDARLEQAVSVRPNATYRISARIRAQGGDGEGAGANVSVADVFAFSEPLYDTGGEWIEAQLYGETGPGQREMVVMARVGGYGQLSAGTAWFDDFRVEEVDSLPEGQVLYDFEPQEDGDEEEGEERSLTEYTPHILLVALLYALLMMWVWQRSRRGSLVLDKREEGVHSMLVLGLCVLFLARLIIGGMLFGYQVDMNCFLGWSGRMSDVGPMGFYADEYFCDYPPGYMYVLWIAGGIQRLFGLGHFSPAAWIVIKFVPIACEIGLAYLLYRYARPRMGENPAAVLALLMAANPAGMVNSAAWGQIDSVLVLLLVIAVWEALSRNYKAALPLFVLAALVKPQALMFAPMGAVLLIWDVAAAKPRKQILARVGMGLLFAVILAAAVALPFSKGQSPLWLFEKYAESLGSYNHPTVNAQNVYVLFDLNWGDLGAQAGPFTIGQWGVLIYVVIFAYCISLYLLGKERKQIFLALAALLVMIFAFATKMHERYAYPALAFLLMAYILCRDVRILAAFAVLSLTQFVNVALVLQAEHLVYELVWLNKAVGAVNVALALFMGYLLWDICLKGHVVPMKALPPREKPAAAAAEDALFAPKEHRLRMRPRDYALMLGLTLAYGVVSLVNLGSLKAPETYWRSTQEGESVVFDLGKSQSFLTTYYGGIADSAFTLAFSEDGENWSEEEQAQFSESYMFRWMWHQDSERDEEDPDDFASLVSGYPFAQGRYVRLTAEAPRLVLHEVAFLGEDAQVLPILGVASYDGAPGRMNDPAALLIDEQDTVPPYPSYYNGMYFDELYHGRTAYEFLHPDLLLGSRPYETTHPQLGKVLIMLGIWVFGMNPFGWRVVGAVFGILMVPAMYLLVKQLFRKTRYAFAGAMLMTWDFMHFTQTRLATIDVYGVFFIMLMYLFMFRYVKMSFYHQKLRSTLIPLMLCGISMGLGIASKWICVYAAAGLAVLLFHTLYLRHREYLLARRQVESLEGERQKLARQVIGSFWKNTLCTLGFCVIWFIAVPLVIYYWSYYWFLSPTVGLSISQVIAEQKVMFGYHSGLSSGGHPFASPWWQWPLIIKPMWFFDGKSFLPEGMASSISTLGSPAVWWVGGAAMCAMIYRMLSGKTRKNPLPFWILIGFLSQYLPWVLVPRSMYIYHYFASVPFIILATLWCYRWIERKRPAASKGLMMGQAAIVLLLFALFYPLLSGYPVPGAYLSLLKWFPGWYF